MGGKKGETGMIGNKKTGEVEWELVEASSSEINLQRYEALAIDSPLTIFI